MNYCGKVFSTAGERAARKNFCKRGKNNVA
jgi:hypothetical protein